MAEYFSTELFTHQLEAMKAEASGVRRKILAALMVTSMFVLSTARILLTYGDPTLILWVLITNAGTWGLWVAFSLSRQIGPSGRHLGIPGEFGQDRSYVEEAFRAHQFDLRRVRRMETGFDVLVGLQFAAIALILASASAW